MTTLIRRFIAGAVCPKCGVSDTIVVTRDQAQVMQARECVVCGLVEAFQEPVEHLSKAPELWLAEVPTRVSVGEGEKRVLDEDEQPLKVWPNPNSDPDRSL